MDDIGHFGCPKFTFDRISGHFRSIGHFGFPIAIKAISDRYRIFTFFSAAIFSRDQALYRAIVVYGDLAQYDDIEAKRGENRPCLADDYF